MAMQPVPQYMAFEQYLLLVNNSDRRYEYYDGEVRLMAGGTSNHATIALNCGVALDQALGDDAACRPYHARRATLSLDTTEQRCNRAGYHCADALTGAPLAKNGH